MRHRLLVAITALYVLAVAWVTLNPSPGDPHGDAFLQGVLAAFASAPALSWVDYDVVEFAANIALFVPVGVLFALLLGAGRRWLAVTLAFAMTLTIEFVQLFEPARVSDARDLLANGLGAVIGVGVVVLVGGRRRVGVRRADATDG